MIYYITKCMYMAWASNGGLKRTKVIFYRAYKRLAYAQKAFEKYKPRALNNDNITLWLYKVDTSETDEDGFYKNELIAEI